MFLKVKALNTSINFALLTLPRFSLLTQSPHKVTIKNNNNNENLKKEKNIVTSTWKQTRTRLHPKKEGVESIQHVVKFLMSVFLPRAKPHSINIQLREKSRVMLNDCNIQTCSPDLRAGKIQNYWTRSRPRSVTQMPVIFVEECWFEWIIIKSVYKEKESLKDL